MFAAAHLAAWQLAVHSRAAWIFTLVLAVPFPLADWLVYLRAPSKFALYLWCLLAEWSLVVAGVAIAARCGLGIADAGQTLGNITRTLSVLVALAVLVGALVALNRRKGKRVATRELRKAVAGVNRLLPASAAERRVFVFVGITAGICEEYLYRGWLLMFFGAALGSIWLGLLVSSALFGFAHVYQGRRGMIGSGVLGFVFGLILFIGRSLVPLQCLHALIDIRNGLALGKLVAQPGAA